MTSEVTKNPPRDSVKVWTQILFILSLFKEIAYFTIHDWELARFLPDYNLPMTIIKLYYGIRNQIEYFLLTTTFYFYRGQKEQLDEESEKKEVQDEVSLTELS